MEKKILKGDNKINISPYVIIFLFSKMYTLLPRRNFSLYEITLEEENIHPFVIITYLSKFTSILKPPFLPVCNLLPRRTIFLHVSQVTTRSV